MRPANAEGPTRWLATILLAVVVGAAGSAASSGPASPRFPVAPISQTVDYRYCLLPTPPYGDTVYFSAVFAVQGGTYAVGVQNRFNAFVAARHDPRTFSGAICLGPYSTRGEAEEARNIEIGSRRRSGKAVIVTRWTYVE